MIAVGVGIAPMIHTLRAIFRHRDLQLMEERERAEREISESDSTCGQSSNQCKIKVKLLYGVVRIPAVSLLQCLFKPSATVIISIISTIVEHSYHIPTYLPYFSAARGC